MRLRFQKIRIIGKEDKVSIGSLGKAAKGLIEVR